MQKINIKLNQINPKNNRDKFKSIINQYGYYVLAIIGLITMSVVFIDSTLAAAKFDINAGVLGGTQPFVDGIKAHWGKAVLLSSAGMAILGEGDPRQRAIRAGIGAGASGMVVLGLLSMLT